MSLFKFVLFIFIIAQTIIHAEASYLACPYVNPICLCIPQERCKSDYDCTNGQKCCMDCCGGHKCTDPVDGRCTRPNEIYDSCGSHCPPTCANRKPDPCIDSCNPGCFCKQGYLKNSTGVCVEEKNCDYIKQ